MKVPMLTSRKRRIYSQLDGEIAKFTATGVLLSASLLALLLPQAIAFTDGTRAGLAFGDRISQKPNASAWKDQQADLNHERDLQVEPATIETYQTNAQNPISYSAANLLATNAREVKPQVANSDHQQYQGPSLAELTATASAAGMLVGDLAGQQSQLYNNNEQDDDDEPADGPNQEDSSRNLMPANGHYLSDDGIRNVIGRGDRVRGAVNVEEVNALGSRLATRRGNFRGQQQREPAIYEGSQEAAAEANQPEQDDNSAEQMADRMPDSMEALIQSERENLGELEGPSDVTSADEGSPQERDGLGVAASAKLADNSDVDQENLVVATNPLGNRLVASSDDNGDGDEDDDDSDSGNISSFQTVNPEQSLVNYQQVAPQQHVPVYEAPIASIAPLDTHLLSPALPQSLIRDSLVDLNTAAGHYYGKKKKKKVKKIVIKKKKKKKYKKVKKVKVIKIKKKKKKVKKKKKPKKHHHHHDHGKYYMYAKVPKKKSWEFGFKKGNKKHWIERHEKGHKNKFKTKVKWYDKKSKGKGFHIWDYNHHDKKKKHYG